MESDEGDQGGPTAFEKRRLALKAFCIKHFLPLGLFTALVVSLALPQPGREVRESKPYPIAARDGYIAA
jgi:hypothetical protein